MTTNNTNLLGRAISIAAQAHEQVTDRGGNAYILHPIRIMMRLRTKDEELMQIAILHDVLEDCDQWTVSLLREEGFSERVLSALELLTHKPEHTYEEYVRYIGTNTDATLVKLEDLKDNSDVTRLKGISEKDNQRIVKYHKAYTYLVGVLDLRKKVAY